MPITTERLLLRRWESDDIEPYAVLCRDPEVMRWIGDGASRSRADCVTAIAGFEACWDANGFGLFAVETLDTGTFIGFAGLAIPEFLPEVMPAVEIGWRLARSSWGRGYATEAARAALAFGFEQCRLDRIISIHQVGNDASGRIMRKLGMRPSLETTDPSCGRAVRVYEARVTERPGSP
ncbi:MAG: GNAT family N-acetyltransferase [Pseudomonadota bacterium]